MKKTLFVSMLVMITAIFLIVSSTGCSPQPNKQQALPETNNLTGQTHDVEINNYAFSPSTLTLNIGDTVKWTNKQAIPHIVVSDSGSELNSPQIESEGTYSHTFNQKGTFAYYCSIHPSMKGTIIVQ